MRAPRPPSIDTSIDREALRVVCDAFDRQEVRMMRKQRAADLAGSKWTEAERDAVLAELDEAEKIAHTRDRRGRRRRGELKRKPGNYPRSRDVHYYMARYWLPVALRALRAHFRIHNPTVLPIKKTWAVSLTAHCLDLNEENFRNFLRGRHRPRLKRPKAKKIR